MRSAGAISALGQARYARILADEAAWATLTRAVEEAGAVAAAAGVRLPTEDAVAAARKLAQAMPGALSSTAQDLARGKRTEIDYLNGLIVQRGEALGVATPANRVLWALVKLMENTAAAAG